MSTYLLKPLQAVRRHEEQDARTGWTSALDARASTEQEAKLLVSAVDVARERLSSALYIAEGAAMKTTLRGADLIGRARHLEWLRVEVRRAEQRLAAFRVGALARARQREQESAAEFRQRRAEREVLDKHEDAHNEAVRREVDRRLERDTGG